MGNIESEEISVTIRVLKVDSKKMTQSVFRQLPVKDVIDNDMNIQGLVWGWVNYHFPKQLPYETNIVWQSGNKLYRCAVRPLTYTPEQAMRYINNPEVNIYRELPHSKLVSAVEKNHCDDIYKISEVFDKYEKVYQSLVASEQLYIAI